MGEWTVEKSKEYILSKIMPGVSSPYAGKCKILSDIRFLKINIFYDMVSNNILSKISFKFFLL